MFHIFFACGERGRLDRRARGQHKMLRLNSFSLLQSMLLKNGIFFIENLLEVISCPTAFDPVHPTAGHETKIA